jgi:hypothetical protein
VNLARVVGPAVAGLILAATGPEVVFGINAASFLGVLVALLVWRRPAQRTAAPERPRPALASGNRYVRHAPGVRRLLLRAALFVVPVSALWGLLPVVSSTRLGLGSSGYGLLLGALGLGAIAGAVTIKRVRALLGRNALMAVSTAAFALGAVACAILTEPALVGVVLVIAGAGWLYALSTLNTTLQLALPSWVRARGLALYLMVFMGGQGVGTLLWGVVAGAAGSRETLLIAAGLLVAGAATAGRWPLYARTGTFDRDIVAPWPEPVLAWDPVPEDGPVLIEVTHRVPAAAARRSGRPWCRWRSRGAGPVRRSGPCTGTRRPARGSRCSRSHPEGEHLRQHGERLTGYDAELLERARALAEEEPGIRHLVPPPA